MANNNRRSRQPGERGRIALITNEEEFNREFSYFVKDTDASGFPFVGINCKWDLTSATPKQRSKNAKKLANQNSRLQMNGAAATAYNKNRSIINDQFAAQNDPTYVIRTNKSEYANVALITISNINGYTLQIRLCLFNRLPQALYKFIESGDYWKVGFGLRKDMYKLWEEEKCHLLSFVDLRYVVMDWKEFRNSYHFRRLGTYSIASYVFDRSFQNTAAAVYASDWYACSLRPEQIYGTADQTQLDVDLFAQVMTKRLNLPSPNMLRDEPYKTRVLEMIEKRKNAAWEPQKYNFAEMPMVRQAFDNSERKFLPESGDWCRCRFSGEASTDLYKTFGAIPYFGVNADAFADMRVKDRATFTSAGDDYALNVEIVEVANLLEPASTSATVTLLASVVAGDNGVNDDVRQQQHTSTSSSDRDFQTYGNRRRTGGHRLTYRDALKIKTAAAATSSVGGPDAATVALGRRMKLMASAAEANGVCGAVGGDNVNEKSGDDDDGSDNETDKVEVDMSVFCLSDSVEDDERSSCNDTRPTSPGPSYWLPPIVGDQFAEFVPFDYENPRFKPPEYSRPPPARPLPPTSGVPLESRFFQPAIVGHQKSQRQVAPPSSLPPARFCRPPVLPPAGGTCVAVCPAPTIPQRSSPPFNNAEAFHMHFVNNNNNYNKVGHDYGGRAPTPPPPRMTKIYRPAVPLAPPKQVGFRGRASPPMESAGCNFGANLNYSASTSRDDYSAADSNPLNSELFAKGRGKLLTKLRNI